MKNVNLVILSFTAIIVIGLSSTIMIDNSSPESDEVVIPGNVKVVMDSKCMGCHNMESKSEKAKTALLLDQLNALTKAKLIFKLGDIEEVMDEDKMPPAKFLEKKPEKKMTSEERDLIKNWAVTTAEDMLK